MIYFSKVFTFKQVVTDDRLQIDPNLIEMFHL
jgi:hypothetical protein